MKNEISDINKLVDNLVGMAVGPSVAHVIWQHYGYKKRPTRGNIWYRLLPKKFELDNHITREVLTMGLIDTLNGIKTNDEWGRTKATS